MLIFRFLGALPYCALLGFAMNSAWALAPLEGLLKGSVRSVSQNDPLKNLFTQQFFAQGTSESQAALEKVDNYKALFVLGNKLEDTCSQERFYTYENVWQEQEARRSVAATLQYIGLDVSSRAIVEYAKAFNLEQKKFENIVDNLIINSCSDNITVFSKKLLRNNLMEMWESKNTSFLTPSHKNLPFVAASNAMISESFTAKEREFDATLKNFRDLCSWDSDVDNYRMMAPYLKNPYLMSIVINNLLGVEISWNKKEKTSVLRPSENSIKVGCEDLICRNRSDSAFHNMFPRMVGSVSLNDDLEVLYCNHFRDVGLKTKNAPDKIKKWMKAQTLEEGKILPMNTVALLTGMPEFMFSVDQFSDLSKLYSNTIEERWDRWAKQQTETLVLDLLFEESLVVDLAPVSPASKSSGDLSLTFDFLLGELDREIDVVDKISASFHLEFPNSFLNWVRRSSISASNRSQYAKLEDIEKKIINYVQVQLDEKRKLFQLELWNEDFARIVANELQSRILAYGGKSKTYGGKSLNALDRGKTIVPVTFRFGLFALKYLRSKHNAQDQVKSLAKP